MEHINPTRVELFKQLGLASDSHSINTFLTLHHPLHAAKRIEYAEFWSLSHKQFIQAQLSLKMRQDWDPHW